MTVLALAQLVPVWDEPVVNLKQVDRSTGAAADAGADLVVFPEQVLWGWDPTGTKGAEPLGGPLTRGLQAIAEAHGIGLVGSIREAAGGGVRNTAVAVDAKGRIVARYAKRHLFSPWGEEQAYAPGEAPALFSCGGLSFGLAICYDLRFPEVFAEYRALGADAVLVPAAWPAERLRHWRLFLQARALDNRIYAAGVSYARGSTPVSEYAGGSAVADPEGELIAEADEGAELLIVVLDPVRIAEVRSVIDPARRPARE